MMTPVSCPTEWTGAEAPKAVAIRELAGVGPFGLAGRFGLARLYATRRLRHGLVRLRLSCGGSVWVSRRTLDSDFQTLREMFVPRKNCYGANYAGAVVVDIGAHKGYYGAFALLKGARCVYSYEPASENYTLLERAAASRRPGGASWETRNAAVGAKRGSGVLNVSAESWAHSLQAGLPPSGPARAVTSEAVQVVAAEDVLAEAVEAAAGRQVIVKIDAEGAECEVCLETDPSIWEAVDELFVEVHDFAPCDGPALVTRLERAGLRPSSGSGPVIRLTRHQLQEGQLIR
jgi:FkbM family methyltransferase